jgi:RHS repeat-associated protein
LDQNFSYDELARLTGVTYGTSSWTLGYDANGNRTGASLNGTNTAYTTPATSNKTSTIGAAALTYDAAGNITGQTGTNAYTTTINLEGRIATLVKGTVTTTYAYNGMGQRVRKFSSSGATSTTVFVYDQQGMLLGEYGNTGTPIREYMWMNNELVAIFTPNGTNPPNIFYVHNDHLGSPKQVYTKANVLRWRWMTEPFGTTAPENTPTAGQAAFTQPIRFPGQYHDTESNLFYNHHRTYDQTSGRYTQSDPIGLAGGINTYAYVNGNPIRYIDPEGLEKLILHGPRDPVQRAAAVRDPDIAGRLIIYAHGNSSAIADTRSDKTVSMTPSQTAALVRASGVWKPGMPITVKACEVAKGNNNFVQGLAKELNVPVTGPNALMVPRVDGKGEITMMPFTWYFLGFTGPAGQYVTANPR